MRIGINAKLTNIAQDRSLDVLFRFKVIEREISNKEDLKSREAL